ncbi:hypothetical protein QE152_g40593 [Popillia japonica]|uniref:Uncharacterized protein n=1 Tax=Popillia japonica TaxID=7064 RepID=A0AAW1HFR0_POPJA
MTAVFTTILGTLLCAWMAISAHHHQNATTGDAVNGGELSLKQTIMSADKIVKSLASDDKIARAVQQPAQDEDEEDEEEEEEEDEEENVEGVEGKMGE